MTIWRWGDVYKRQEQRIADLKKGVKKAKAVEEKNKGEISKLISDAETYLKAHFKKDYYNAVKASCVQEKALAKEQYRKNVENLEKEQDVYKRQGFWKGLNHHSFPATLF